MPASAPPAPRSSASSGPAASSSTSSTSPPPPAGPNLPPDDLLIAAIFGDQLRAAGGKTRAEVAREYYARLAEESARLAPLEVQCDWLREIGFESVDVYLKLQELALFGGQRPEAK
jgi:hypothetical protein